MREALINAALFCYFFVMVLSIAGNAFGYRHGSKLVKPLFTLGTMSTAVWLAAQWFVTGHPPMADLGETLILFSFCLTLCVSFFEFAYRLTFPIEVPALMALLSLGYAALLDPGAKPLLPALKSNWLLIHVSAYLVGYGAAGLAFSGGIIYLFASSSQQNNNILSERLDDIFGYRVIAFAFIFMTIGLSTGAVWANTAWGSYWSWDPKETWALITWLFYLAYLHLRWFRELSGRKAAYLVLCGFGIILFTFVGLNFVTRGLHSYS